MMPAKRSVYVSSRLDNWAQVERIQGLLQRSGIEIAHDWASIARRELTEPGYQPPDDLSRIQIDAATHASCFLLLTPGGRGAHIEYGAALGVGVWTVVLMSEGVRKIGFYDLADAVVHDEAAAVAAVVELLGPGDTR